MNLVVIGVPYAEKRHTGGALQAPELWRSAGLLEQLVPMVTQAAWVSLQDPAPAGSKEEQLVALGNQLRETVRTIHQAGAIPLVLGGGPELVALGATGGLHSGGRKPGIAWFGGSSSFGPDEPLALLAGRGQSLLSQGMGVEITPEWRMLLAGDREEDPADTSAIDLSATSRWSARDLELAGASDLGRDVADWPSVYLHLDLGVLSSDLMPAADRPVPGGLSMETVIAGIESVAAAGRVDAIGITGYNPDHDRERIGLETSIQVIEAAVRIVAL